LSVDLRASGGGQIHPRNDADPDHGEVAVDHLSAGRANPLQHAIALQRFDAVARHQLDTLARGHVSVEGADLGAEDPFVRKRQRVDQLTSSPR
jgi:hypothetical protein